MQYHSIEHLAQEAAAPVYGSHWGVQSKTHEKPTPTEEFKLLLALFHQIFHQDIT